MSTMMGNFRRAGTRVVLYPIRQYLKPVVVPQPSLNVLRFPHAVIFVTPR